MIIHGQQEGQGSKTKQKHTWPIAECQLERNSTVLHVPLPQSRHTHKKWVISYEKSFQKADILLLFQNEKEVDFSCNVW